MGKQNQFCQGTQINQTGTWLFAFSKKEVFFGHLIVMWNHKKKFLTEWNPVETGKIPILSCLYILVFLRGMNYRQK